MRYQAGFVNLAAAPLLEIPVHEHVFTERNPLWQLRFINFAPATFRDAAAGWVARGIAAPFVRVLEVRDAAPEEAAAALEAALEAANV